MKQLFHNPVFRLAIAVVMFAIMPACSKRGGAGGRDSKIDYWTCTMHPSVREKGPGKCPICSMDLVPVMKESATPALSSKNAPHHDHAAMLAGKPTPGPPTQPTPPPPPPQRAAPPTPPPTTPPTPPAHPPPPLRPTHPTHA